MSNKNIPPVNPDPAPRTTAPGGPDFTSSQNTHDPQGELAAGDQTSGSHLRHDTQSGTAAGSTSTDSQPTRDDQIRTAVRGPIPPDSHNTGDTPVTSAVGDQATRDDHRLGNTQRTSVVSGPILADPVLGVLADVVDDLEKVRIANENRLRTLTGQDEYGHGLTLHNPEVARLAATVDALADAEHQAILNLKRSMRRHPLGVWAKPLAGVGEKQLARLLSVIGDPYWNDLHDRPRTVSELWAFCGYHVLHTSGQDAAELHGKSAAGVAPKRQRGQQSNWNEDARKRTWLIAASCVKQKPDTLYRSVYDETRAHYAAAVHNSSCVRCGPAGKPAQPGSPLSLGHQHARAIRKVAKTLLRDLWREAKRLHEIDAETEIAA